MDHIARLGVLAKCAEYVQRLSCRSVRAPGTLYKIPGDYSIQTVNDYQDVLVPGPNTADQHHLGNSVVPRAYRVRFR